MADSNGGGISRRHVIAGVAWSAPAILVATAVPAAAGSLATGALVYIGLNAKAVANFVKDDTHEVIPSSRRIRSFKPKMPVDTGAVK